MLKLFLDTVWSYVSNSMNNFKGRFIKNLFSTSKWYQSDHGIFMAKGIPAMAVTEESFQELLAEITHSEKDRPDIVDPAKLVANASVLYDLVIEMNKALKWKRAAK